jgi:hypothetical protein
MSKYGRIKWYRFKVANKIRLLEGKELISEVQEIILDIRDKKLDENGLFKLLIQDLESLISETQEKLKGKQKAREFDPFHIPRSGNARIALFGLSNVGKSTLMNAITNTDVKTGDFLHTTRIAQAGTCEIENLRLQIIDLPGFLDFREEWIVSKQILRVARTCDAIFFVIDLTMNIERQLNFLIDQLIQAKLYINGESVYKLGIIATKGDLPGSKENFIHLQELTDLHIIPVSINIANSLEKLKRDLIGFLDIIRVYTKPPKGKPETDKPYVLPKGACIRDISEKIHKDFLKYFRYAKVWGKSVDYPRKSVGIEHELEDQDIVEILIDR